MWKGSGELPDEVVIRPLQSADVDAAGEVAWSSLRAGIPEEHVAAFDEGHRRRGSLRIAHLQSTDPGGAWLAEADGDVVGVALALIREGLWGLSLLAVTPDRQGTGVGTRLLAAALTYASGTRGAIILSSLDPRAMRGYARAGFSLRPCVSASGVADLRAIPGGLRSRPGDPVADRDLCDAASRAVRGAAHGADVERMIEGGGTLLVHDAAGFAVHGEGRVWLLAATSEDIARDLLWSCLADMAPGTTASIEFVTAGQDWAIEVALAANLALSPDGPLFVRGEVGPLRPYLPSGAYL
jgi:GNAT superfamily N-acetyltransferase